MFGYNGEDGLYLPLREGGMSGGGDAPASGLLGFRRVISPRSGAAISLGIFVVLLTIYAFSPVRTPFDSRWSLHTAMSMVRGHGGDLTEYMPALKRNDFYAIEYPGGRPHTYFPIGASILAMPAVAVAWWVRPAFFAELQDHVPDGFEKIVASIIGAAAAVVFFWLVYSQFEVLGTAFAATAIFALGTSMWSTATRALWQHGPLVLMFTIVMLLTVRASRRPALVQYAGLPLAMAYIIRPTAAVAIVVISVYVFVFYRAWFLQYIGWAMIAAVPWIAFNYWIYGAMLPPYYAPSRIAADLSFIQGLLGILFSPSRGLLVFTPVMAFAVSGFVLSLREPEQRPLHIAFGAIVLGITSIIAAWPEWRGGHAFGPRLMTDVVPFLVYFVAFNFRLPAGTSRPARVWLSSSVAVFAAVGVVIHAQGALRTPPMYWNVIPNNIDQNQSRLWDWKDPQFLRLR
jgi:hypothetical protein